MSRHPPGETNVDWRVHIPDSHSSVNTNLDSVNLRRCRVPDALAWIRNSSIIVIGDLIVGCVMEMMRVSLPDILLTYA